MKNKSVIRGASILGITTFFVKLFGALYRIPLTNIIGGVGIGLYQMIFPVYALLLDFSGCALPSALSKLISSEQSENAKFKYLSVSLKIFFIIGAFCTLFLFIFALPISKLQGNEKAFLGYLCLAPAVLTVSILSCFRGYFQGQLKMTPTALSQIIEQVIKLIFGLILAKVFLPNISMAIAGTTFAITLSEIVALIYVLIEYKKQNGLPLKSLLKIKIEKSDLKAIFKTIFPITLMGIILPFSQVIDSFLTINIIGKYRVDATVLYGLFSGVCLTIINLPVAICHGISVVAIPTVSKIKDIDLQNKNIKKVIFLTLILAIPFAIGCFFLSPLIVKFLFRALDNEQTKTAILLIKLTSPTIITLSLLQTLNSVLIGKGKLYSPVVNLFISVVVKVIFNFFLLQNPSINIYAGGIALNACYFLACLLNLNLVITRKRVKNGNARTLYRENFS